MKFWAVFEVFDLIGYILSPNSACVMGIMVIVENLRGGKTPCYNAALSEMNRLRRDLRKKIKFEAQKTFKHKLLFFIMFHNLKNIQEPLVVFYSSNAECFSGISLRTLHSWKIIRFRSMLLLKQIYNILQ